MSDAATRAARAQNSAAEVRSARPAPPRAGEASRMPTANAVVGALFVAAMAALAVLAAWPIYRTGSFVLLAVVATAVGAAVAVLARWRRWGGWTVAAVLAAAILILGVPLAVPSRLGGPLELVRGIGDVAVGAVFAWKDLVTVDLPVGSYRNLLVPALIVFLVGTCAALCLAWSDGRAANASVAVTFGMLAFGLFFGRTTVSPPVVIGPFTLFAPAETAIGAAGLVVSVLWLAWRSRDQRMRALRHAASALPAGMSPRGVRLTRRSSSADRRRGALAAGMVAVAVAAAVAIVPAAAQGRERDVLRAAAGPELALAEAVSPLAAYRGLFADDRADDVVFSVSSSAAAPTRIRLATLDSYDGEVFRSGGAVSGPGGSAFVRVPSRLDPGAGDAVEAEVAVGELAGIWMPTAGRLANVVFAGPRAAALTERFYYSAEAQAGVQTAGGGLRAGDAYAVSAVESDAADLASIQAPGAAAAATDGVTVDAPGNLRAWMDEHATGSDGAALEGLATLLRERGYLSHGLSRGSVDPVWMQSLDGYAFQPSAAGHSLSRIDAMFGRLLAREADPRAATTGDYVAAVGDDEQFAVAIALIAHELGFPARVVVGARLTAVDPDLAVCADGVCRAQDLSAWTEVLSADGEWVPVDATPQHRVSPSLDLTEQRDPEIVTEVRPDAVTDVVPPESLQDDTANRDDATGPAGLDLSWLWPALRGVAVGVLVLLILLGPALVVVAAKVLRRRARRTHPDPATRIAGGWDEYLDAAADAGRGIPRTATRPEIAAALSAAGGAAGDGSGGAALAADADAAAFSERSASADDAADYWRRVDAERAALAEGRGFWRRLLAAVSLRSFLRVLAPGTARREPRSTIERRRRRPAARARPST
jgi:hypothetical protein